jgi:hypothetical protein
MFTVGQEKFVTGLHWKTLSGRNYMREARKIGARYNWAIVTVRKGARIQAGFVARGVGATTGMYSVGSALAGVLGNNWVGAFKVDTDRYVVVAVRDGSIIPSYDRIASQDEAVIAVREAFNLIPSTTTDVKIYTPREFGLGDKELLLEDVLAPKNLKRDYQLRLLGFPWGRVALILGILGASLIGWTEYQNYQAEEVRKLEEAERQRKERELAELNARAREEQHAKALEHPWAKMPAAGDLTQTCAREINAIPLSLAGWLVDTVKCDGDKLVAVYRRNGIAGAPLNEFRKAAEPLEKSNLSIVESGERGEITRSVSVPLAGDEELQDPKELTDEWISRMQLLGASFKLEEKTVVLPTPPTPPGQQPLPAPVATWRLFSLMYEGGINPVTILSGMGDLRGVRVKTMEAVVNREGGVKWSMQGELYAKK